MASGGKGFSALVAAFVLCHRSRVRIIPPQFPDRDAPPGGNVDLDEAPGSFVVVDRFISAERCYLCDLRATRGDLPACHFSVRINLNCRSPEIVGPFDADRYPVFLMNPGRAVRSSQFDI